MVGAAPAAGRCRAQRPVRVEVVARRLCLGQRPLHGVAPVASVAQASVLVPAAVARAHHEEADRRPVVGLGRPPLEMAVEPLPVQFAREVGQRGVRPEVDVPRVRAGIAAVRPGSDQQPLRRRPGGRQTQVVLEHAAAVGVVPAGDVQHRHVRRPPVVPAPAHADAVPVPEVGVGGVVVPARQLGEHVVLERGRPGERAESRAQGHRREPVADLLRLERRPHHRIGRDAELVERPAELLSQLERAVVADLVRPGAGDAALVQQQRPQVRRVHLGRVRLRMRAVGGAEHADVAGSVGERRGPLDRVVAVGRVEVVVLRERALRPVAPAGVLEHHDVPPLDEVQAALDEPASALAVRRSLEQHRQRLFDRHAVPGRAIDVGGEADAVAHRHHDVCGEQHGVVGLGNLRLRTGRTRRHGADDERQQAGDRHSDVPCPHHCAPVSGRL